MAYDGKSLHHPPLALTPPAEIAAIGCDPVEKAAIAERLLLPSALMEPTLLIGDELLATKIPLWVTALPRCR